MYLIKTCLEESPGFDAPAPIVVEDWVTDNPRISQSVCCKRNCGTVAVAVMFLILRFELQVESWRTRTFLRIRKQQLQNLAGTSASSNREVMRIVYDLGRSLGAVERSAYLG